MKGDCCVCNSPTLWFSSSHVCPSATTQNSSSSIIWMEWCNYNGDRWSNLQHLLVATSVYIGRKFTLPKKGTRMLTGWSHYTVTVCICCNMPAPQPASEAIGKESFHHECEYFWGIFSLPQNYPNIIELLRNTMGITVELKNTSVCKHWQHKNQMWLSNNSHLINKHSELRSILESHETQADLSS